MVSRQAPDLMLKCAPMPPRKGVVDAASDEKPMNGTVRRTYPADLVRVRPSCKVNK